MAQFTPFADDATALTMGGLTIENGHRRISFSGALDITRDGAGLAQVEALKAVVDAIHDALKAAAAKPPVAATRAPRATRKNPFT